MFRFRAQAALDLRRRQEEDALRHLARAEEDRDRARRRLEDAKTAAAVARGAAAAAAENGASITTLEWYRFWILRLDHERATSASVLGAREYDVKQASEACMRARQKCESLQRLKDKARRQYDAAENAAEQKLIDNLAVQRFAAARATR